MSDEKPAGTTGTDSSSTGTGAATGSGGSGGSPLGTAVKGGKAAIGFFGGVWKTIRFFLPKKWTKQNIIIAAIVLLVLGLFVWWVVSTVFWMLKWILIVGFAVVGLYFIFGPRPKG